MAFPALRAPAVSFGSGSLNSVPLHSREARAGCRVGLQDFVFIVNFQH